MKILSFFSSLLIVALTAGCVEPDCCELGNSNIFLVNLQNSEGANLLDPQTEGAIDLDKTRLFLLENGVAEMVKYESPGAVLDHPYGVMRFEENGVYRVQFSFENKGSQKEIQGFIQWNEVLADSLNFTFNSTGSATFLTKVSQKGTILWDVETDPENEIVITLEH